MYVSLKVSSFFYAFGLKVSIFSLCLWPYDNSMLIKPISLFFFFSMVTKYFFKDPDFLTVYFASPDFCPNQVQCGFREDGLSCYLDVNHLMDYVEYLV